MAVSTINFTGADYTSISTWERDTDNDLVSTTTIETLEFYSDLGNFSLGNITISGATTNASYYRMFRPNSDDKWGGDLTPTAAAALAASGNNVLKIQEDYFRIEDMFFDTPVTSSRWPVRIDNSNCLIRNCLFDEGSGVNCEGNNNDIVRCFLLDCYDGIDVLGTGNTISNCTIYGGTYGVYVTEEVTVYNTYSGNHGDHDFYELDGNGSWHSNSAGNMSDGGNWNTMPTGLNNVTVTTNTNPGAGNWYIVQNITAGSEDFTLEDDADNDAIGYGTTLTALESTDAFGNSANTNWDVGAFNLPSTGPTINDITISSSLDVNTATNLQRWRDRVSASELDLSSYVVLNRWLYRLNEVNLSLSHYLPISRLRTKVNESSIDLNDVTYVFRERFKAVITPLVLSHYEHVARWRDRITSSSLAISDYIKPVRWLYRLNESNLSLSHYLPISRLRTKVNESNLSLSHEEHVFRSRDKVVDDSLDISHEERVFRSRDKVIDDSLDLSHEEHVFRSRDRVIDDSFELTHFLTFEQSVTYLINSILISSDLTLNDGTNIQRHRDRVSASELDLESFTNIQRYRDRVSASELDLGSTIGVQRERDRIIDSAIALGTHIGQQLERNRKPGSSIDIYDDMGIHRHRVKLLESFLDLDSSVDISRELDRALTSALEIYDLLTIEEIENSFNFAVARDNVPTDTTTIDITTSNFGGDIPKAAIIVLTEAITNTTEATHNQLSIGFCDGSTQGYVRTQSVSGGDTSVASRRFFSNAVMSRTTPGNTDAGITASFDSFITNGVRLTASSTYGAGYLVHAILFGGSTCDVDVGISDSHLSGNSVSVTNPGFEPSIVFFLYCSNDADAADMVNSSHSFGVAVNDGDETQRCVFHHASDAASTSVTQGGIFDESVLRHGVNENSKLTSFDASGFTLEAIESGNPNESLYLAIKLDNGFFNLQTYTAPDATGDVTVSNLDFRPEALIMCLMFVEQLNSNISTGGGGPFGVYMADGTDEFTAMVRDRDNVTTMETASRAQDKLRFDGHTGSSGYAATLSSFNAGGFTHNYTAANNNERLFWSLAFAGPDTARHRARSLLSSLVLTHNLTYTALQFILNAITLHSELEVNDAIHVERRVLRLVETFVPIYDALLQQANRQRQLTDNFVLYEDILQDAIKVLSDILLHDNLELSDNVVISLQRLFKPIGIIIYGLGKAGIQYGLKHAGKIEYTLQGQKKIIYTLENIKGDTVYY